MRPLDYSALSKDEEYLTILRSIASHKLQYLRWQESVIIGGLDELVISLQKEVQ